MWIAFVLLSTSRNHFPDISINEPSQLKRPGKKNIHLDIHDKIHDGNPEVSINHSDNLESISYTIFMLKDSVIFYSFLFH